MFSSRSLLIVCLAFLAVLCALALPVEYQNLVDEQSESHVVRAGGYGQAGGHPPQLQNGQVCVNLVRENVGLGNEHWALFFSTVPMGSGTYSRPFDAYGHYVEAVWDGHSAAPLQVDSRGPFRRQFPFQVGQARKMMVPLGCVQTVQQMQALLNYIWVHAAPTRPPRQENCTVFVRNALQLMAQHNPNIRYRDVFLPIFNAFYWTVKANTDPHFTYA